MTAVGRLGAVIALALVALLGAVRLAPAHEASMAVLQLRETTPGQFLGRWVMAPSAEAQGLKPIFPPQCQWDQLRLDCGTHGLSGRLGFEGLGSKQSAVLIRVQPLEGEAQAYTLSSAHPSVTITRDPGSDPAAWLELADTYVNLGIDHILLGVDHLLFVLGLIWIVRGARMLVRTITFFTVGHSLSLAAATFGVIGVPERPLNAAIALSIVYVGVEIVKQQRGEDGWTARFPWVVAFCFGLLHGLGFATALTTLGIPASTLPYALLFFNVGVEIGQLAFVLLVLALGWAHRALSATLPRWGAALPAYVIGAVAMFWFLTRIEKLLLV